jgi:hypothetical protein
MFMRTFKISTEKRAWWHVTVIPANRETIVQAGLCKKRDSMSKLTRGKGLGAYLSSAKP